MMQLAQTLADGAAATWEKLEEYPDRVYFPNFGDGDNALRSGIDIDRVMFTIPGTNFKIYWYGFLIAVGIVLALIYGFKRMKKAGIDPDRATDAVIGGFFGAIIGARLYYVIFSDTTPITKFFDFRDGGLAIYGGVIGAILVGGYITKLKKLRLMTMLDVAAPCFFIGQAIGRWGNFFNQECFGTNTDKPWGMISLTTADYVSKNITDGSVDPLMPIHPCFLYESLWCLAGFILLHLYFKHRKFDGEVFLCYTGWYGLGRFFIEGLRTDSLYIGSIRASQLLAGLCFVASIAVIVVVRINIHKYKDYVFFKDTELSREQILQYENTIRFEKERKQLKAKIADAKKNGEDTAELEKEYDEQFGEAAKKNRQDALEKAEKADLKAATERKAARAKLKGEDPEDEPKTEEKSEEIREEPKTEEKSEEIKEEPKTEEKSEETKEEPKAEEKPEETKEEPKAEEKPEETKEEPKTEKKTEESKPEASKAAQEKVEETKSEEKTEETKSEVVEGTEEKAEETKQEPRTDNKPKQNNNSGQKKNNNNRNRNKGNKNKNGNKQAGQRNNRNNQNKPDNKQGGNKNNNRSNNNKPKGNN